MFPWNSRRARQAGRDRFRPGLGLGSTAPEALEGRQLLAYSALGTSLPDLTVSGFASTAASWGGQLTVTVNVRNLGASTIIEPLALNPGATSSADAPASTVAVFAVTNPHSLRGAVQVGSVDIPAVTQNNAVQITQSFTLPARPAGFPGDGGKVYLVFKANATGTVFETDTTNNVSAPVPLFIQAPLPELSVVGFDIPPVIQPGDVIQPNIRIANFGPADTGVQGPVGVALVASTTPQFVPGSSSVLATYTVSNIPGVQNVANQGGVFSDANLNPQQNIVTIVGDPVMLPTGPAKYYIGVVVDPFRQITQLQSVGNVRRPKEPFSMAHLVGPPIAGLPPAGQIVPGGAANVPVFPFPFGGVLVGGTLDGSIFPAPFPPGTVVSTGITSAGTPSRPGSIGATSTSGAGVGTGSGTDNTVYPFPTPARRVSFLTHTPKAFTVSATNFAGFDGRKGQQVAVDSLFARLNGDSNA